MRSKHPILGKLYSYNIGEYVTLHIGPAEIATHAAYKGMIIGYIFNNNKTAIQLYKEADKLDLLIPPVLLYPQFFRDGTFTYIENPQFLQVPFYRPHVFYNDQMNKYRDLQGNTLSGPGECTSEECIHSLLSLCEELVQALGLDIDCSALIPGVDPAEEAKSAQLPEPGYVNRRPLLMTVVLQLGSMPEADAFERMGNAEVALDTRLRQAQAGALIGHMADESGDVIELKIKAKRYPQALPAIRAAMEEAGVTYYELRCYK